MKKCKAVLSLVLVLALMLALLAACGQSESGEAGSAANTGNESTNAGAADSNTDLDYGDEDDDGELATIEFWYFDLRMTAGDYGAHVEEAINAITEEKINTHVNMNYYTVADFGTNFTLAMSGGEQIDLVQIFTPVKLATLYANNQLTDITDLMTQYAPQTLELMADYIGTYTYDGRIYGVPTMRNYCTNGYIVMRKDILQELNLVEKAENMTTWSEFEEIMAAVTDAYAGSGMYALCKGAGYNLKSLLGAAVNNSDRFADIEVYDNLGDSLSLVYTDTEGNVSLSVADSRFEQEIADSKVWFDNGWVFPDSPMVDTHGDELLKQGVSFATIQSSEIGVEVTKGSSIGYELVCTQTYTGMIKTGTLTGWGCAVPTTSEEPAAAVKMINLMYTDSDIMNLLTWGVEGTDYELVDGQVKHVDGGHYYEADFLIGNNLLLTPLYGNGADFYDRVAEIVSSATISPYLGFAMNTADLDLVIGQLSAVNDQYQASLLAGLYTPELYQDFLAKLDAAGVQDYLNAFQTQLDAWMATR